MGAGQMYPMHPYPDENYPHYHHGGHPVPPYGYPYSYGPGYARPMPNYPPMMPNFQANIYPNLIGGRGLFSTPRGPETGGLQSAPPSAGPNGNLYLHRPGPHRPHFDHQ